MPFVLGLQGVGGAGPTYSEVTRLITAGADDGYISGAATFAPADSYLYIGNFDGVFANLRSYMRWTTITIPQGRHIQSAFLDLPIDWNQTAVSTPARIRGVLGSNPATIAGASDFDTRPRTTAFVDWVVPPGIVASPNFVTSPDLSPIIQELANQAGGIAGAVMLTITGEGFTWATGTAKTWLSFEANAAWNSRLRITRED